MIRIALTLFIALFALAAHAQQPFVTLDPGVEAWWVRARFNPQHQEVRGIPVAQIQKDWCKASEFTREAIPKDLLNEGGSDIMAETGFGFSIEGNFDRSKTRQVALVGVYETCRKARGSFVLILDKDTQRIRFVDTMEDEHQFAALKAEGGTIHVAYCMECDVGSALRWNAKRKAFVWIRR
jgi:hypothetical protein